MDLALIKFSRPNYGKINNNDFLLLNKLQNIPLIISKSSVSMYW